jgi:hypothetical protein
MHSLFAANHYNFQLENTYAKLFVKHDFFSLIYGLMHANFAKDNELTMLCCLILHNLTARGKMIFCLYSIVQKWFIIDCQIRKAFSTNCSKASIIAFSTQHCIFLRTPIKSAGSPSTWNDSYIL